MMKKRILALACTLSILVLAGCGRKEAPVEEQEGLTVLATTYPVYLMAKTLTAGVEDVTVQRLNTGNISCLHDYTLTVDDMKLIESADLIAINGVGLETFMEDALAAAQSEVVDCSQGVELLESLAHHHEEGDEQDHGHFDPHIWLDPENAQVMVANLGKALSAADPVHTGAYAQNAAQAAEDLEAVKAQAKKLIDNSAAEITGLITFHDGFQYFAQAFDLELLAAIEEEAGSEASAKEINEITGLVKDRGVSVIFTERNGSDATARAIARETGCAVGELDMLMSGQGEDLSDYAGGVMGNVAAVINGFAGAKVVSVG